MGKAMSRQRGSASIGHTAVLCLVTAPQKGLVFELDDTINQDSIFSVSIVNEFGQKLNCSPRLKQQEFSRVETDK